MSLYMNVQDMEAILQWMHLKTDNYMSRVPHVMYGSLGVVNIVVAFLRICMKMFKITYTTSKTCLQCLEFAINIALDLLLTCSRVAAGEGTFLPLRPRKSGHEALSCSG